jgi:hypothetical protein
LISVGVVERVPLSVMLSEFGNPDIEALIVTPAASKILDVRSSEKLESVPCDGLNKL